MKLSLSRGLALAATLALSIVPAFAQLSFNGYYRVGSMTNDDSSGNLSTVFQDRIRLNISFVAPDDMFGFKTRLQADSSVINNKTYSGLVNLFLDGVSGTVDTTAAASKTAAVTTTVTPPGGDIKYGYGYGKFLDGMIKISAGYLDLTDYSVAENTGNYYFGNVFTDDVNGMNTGMLSGQKGRFLGTALQVWPIEGLSLAATMRTDGSKLAAHHFGFDGYYLIPGLGKALVASQLGVYSATASAASDDLSRSFVSAGFQYVGFPGLSATAAFRSTYGTAWDAKKAASALGAVAIVEYSAGPLFADLSTDVDFTNSHYYLEGELSYLVIPQVKVRVYGAYQDVANSNIGVTTLANGAVNTAAINNAQAFGMDIVLPIAKGEVQAGFLYTDKANLQFPILVKANF